MEISTLRGMTAELCGRTVNPAIEEHLPQYAAEVATILAAVRAAAQTFPSELAPAAVFSLFPGPAERLRAAAKKAAG